MKYKILLIYDIPVSSKENRKKYQKFHKYIIHSGFLMLQESVYVKSMNTSESYSKLKSELKTLSPSNSNIRILKLTDKTFEKLEVIRGNQTLEEKILSNNIRILEF